MCKTYHWGVGGGGSLLLTLSPRRGKFMNAPVNPEGVAGASNDCPGSVICFSSHAKMTNEIQICFSK